jgi:hypothetical protein
VNNIFLTGLETEDNHATSLSVDGQTIGCRAFHEPRLQKVEKPSDVTDLVKRLAERVDQVTEFQVAQRFVHLQLVDAAVYEQLVRSLTAARFRVLVGPSRAHLKEL